MSTSPPTLNYPDSLQRDELSIEQREGQLVVVTPSLKRWKKLSYAAQLTIIYFAIPATAMLVGVIIDLFSHRFAGLPALGLYVSILIVTAFLGSIRLPHSYVIQLDARQLRIVHRISRHVTKDISYRRELVGNVHVNASDGRLVIPIVRHALVQLIISDKKADVVLVADAIARGMQQIEMSADRSVPELVNNLTTPITEKDRRTALYVIIAVSTFCGLLLSALIHPAVGFWVFFGGLCGCGIVLGTQEKKFWL